MNAQKSDADAQEKYDLANALQSLRASDSIFDDANIRVILRAMLGLEEKIVVVPDRKYSAIPASPIRSTEVILAYLQRGYDVLPHAAHTTAPIGRPILARDQHEFAKNPFGTSKVPLNATVSLRWPNSLVLVFDTSFVKDGLAKFESEIADLSGVPVIIGKCRATVLLTVPPSHYISRTGALGDTSYLRAERCETYPTLAPPSFDPDGNLAPLSFRDGNSTVPVSPSARLTTWLRSVGVINETDRK